MNAPRLPWLATLATLAIGASFALPLARATTAGALRWPSAAVPFVFASCGLFAAVLAMLRPPRTASAVLLIVTLGGAAAIAPLWLLAFDFGTGAAAPAWRSGFWYDLIGVALLAAVGVRGVAALAPTVRAARRLAPWLLGAWLLVFWQLLTQVFEVPALLLPAPHQIGHALLAARGLLAGDLLHTLLREAAPGLVAGSALGFGAGAVLALAGVGLPRGAAHPLALLGGAVALVAVAPWSVADAGSPVAKAALVGALTFFPMLTATLAAFAAVGADERDLMRSWGAGRGRTLAALQVPAARPALIATLRANATLAMLAAVVVEFLVATANVAAAPTAGLGVRIADATARLDTGLAWAAALLALVGGALLNALVGAFERRARPAHARHDGVRASLPAATR